MVIYFKPEIGTMQQTAFVMDGTKCFNSFAFSIENLGSAIYSHCQQYPTISEVVLLGSYDMMKKFQLDIEQQNIVNYANQPLKITIQTS